jgi:hypothetical protein
MVSKRDKFLLSAAFVIFVITIGVSFVEPSQGRDPMSRVNLIFFSFLLMSLFVGLCTSIKAVTWAWITFGAGLILWIIATWFGDPGGWASVIDTFRL